MLTIGQEHWVFLPFIVLVLGVVLALVVAIGLIRRAPRGRRLWAVLALVSAVADVVLFIKILEPTRDYVLLGALVVAVCATVTALYFLTRPRVAGTMEAAHER